jgi:Tfp pilus assembly pilus retraction ATPase PilT
LRGNRGAKGSFCAATTPACCSAIAAAGSGVVCQRLCRPRQPGRPVALFELLNIGPATATLIRQGKPRELHGTMFLTFDNALVGCVKDEQITREEALRQATDADNVRRLLGPGN